MTLVFHEDLPFNLITDQICGCRCVEPRCTELSQCTCLDRFGPVYSNDGLLQLFDRPVYECNSDCTCSSSCQNRVVQRFVSLLEQTNVSPSYRIVDRPIVGHGLIAARDFQRGELICIYSGEIILYSEACRREIQQTTTKGRNYVLILRSFSGSSLTSVTCIDGDVFLPDGSKPISRFINHSCDPNLTVVPVYVDCLIPYAALFASRLINVGSELTYDYASAVPTSKQLSSDTVCHCQSKNCRGFLPRVE